MVCAGGGAGLVTGAGAEVALPSGAAGGGTLRTLLTRSVSRDTEGVQDGRMDG